MSPTATKCNHNKQKCSFVKFKLLFSLSLSQTQAHLDTHTHSLSHTHARTLILYHINSQCRWSCDIFDMGSCFQFRWERKRLLKTLPLQIWFLMKESVECWHDRKMLMMLKKWCCWYHQKNTSEVFHVVFIKASVNWNV